MRKLMTIEDVAKHLSVSVKTLANWRTRGQGPPFVKVGSLVRYERADLVAWQDGQKVKPGEVE